MFVAAPAAHAADPIMPLSEVKDRPSTASASASGLPPGGAVRRSRTARRASSSPVRVSVSARCNRSRARADNPPLNLDVLRHLALNLAKTNPEKGSIRGKLKRAGWNNAFLAALMLQMR